MQKHSNGNINIELNEKHFETEYETIIKNIHSSFHALEEELTKENDEEMMEELQRVDVMEQDVLHIVELMNFNAVEGFTFAKMLKTIRQARRKVKDRMTERQKMKKILKQYATSNFKNNLKQAIKSTEQEKVKKSQRSYRLRNLKELEGFISVIEKQKQELREESNKDE